MSRIIDEDNRHEFPFPRMDSFRSSSPSSGSLPSRFNSSQSKSLHSSVSSGSHIPRARVEQDYDSLRSGVPSKLLSRLMPREHHDTRSLRTILAVTTERLESETRRADDAERRVLEVLRKLRTAHEATMLAQSDAARAREELTLYKYRLEDAQREISRAQEIINELEQEKLEAEAEAARARSTARRYREQQLVAQAREEGRQEGFQEGFSRGKDMGFQEALETESVSEPVEDRRHQKRPVLVEEVEDEEGEIAPSRYRAGTPAPDFRSRTPASDIRVRTPGPEYRARTPGSSGAQWRPPSRMTQSGASQRSQPQARVSDTAHFAATLPVPTLTTPLNAPSPSHSRVDISTPMPRPSSRPVRSGDVPPPIPIQEPLASPAHPPVNIPPDGWIPYENPSGEISLPPPHELSRPVTPRSMSPAPPADAPAPPQSSRTQDAQMRPRDYLYANPNASQSGTVSRSNTYRPFSPQSKASTSISQFDLVAPRGKSRGAPRAREDRVPMSPRGPRPREDLPPVRPEMGERNDTATTNKSPEEQNGSPTTPLERVFKRRFRRGPSKDSVIPDIVVQTPSTPATSRSSTRTQITHPHLLSPEHHPQPLNPPDDIIVMPVTIPNYYPTGPSVPGPYKPPYLDDDDESPVIPPPPEGLPAGFVPLTPPMRPGSASGNPIPIPSNSPLPVPPSNPLPIPSSDPLPVPHRGPLPIPQNNPLPIPPRNPLPVPDKGPVQIPHNDPVPIPHNHPIPIPHDEPLPVPHRSGTPGRQRYAEASLPSGMVYPSPPSRRARTLGPSVSSPSGSRRGLRDLRSPGERLSPLPLDFFAPLRSDTNTE
ncbi:hypothetical protein BV20DRAFT_951950 [Pilatotrama ljubarskyi]|nr:hypothetical protein BV20DRAFT_951950 [Pilatotrama ljubarskyi]